MPDYDVIVIGGGPAGATVSTLLAQRDVRVALYERERFPRFHIGESLIPETYWVLQRLNMLPKMKASPFVKRMLQNAREHGVEAHEGVHVLEVLFDGNRAAGVRMRDASGERREVRAKVVVDASGQAALLQNRFRLRLWDPVLNKGAVWTYWKGAYRDTGRDEGATMVIQTSNRSGWFWYIPQHDDIVSVGVVAPFDYLFNPAKVRNGHEQTYQEEVER